MQNHVRTFASGHLFSQLTQIESVHRCILGRLLPATDAIESEEKRYERGPGEV
jgi:hypothetical protein